MINNPILYEINTRIWIKQFDTSEKKANFSDIPDGFLDQMAEKGINCLWFMGIWENNPSTIQKYCFTEDLKNAYTFAYPEWKPEDIIGSPFSINKYEVNQTLGTIDGLLSLRKRVNERGMKLILDFVPNHFSAESEFIELNPAIFLQADELSMRNDPHTFYKSDGQKDIVFAHGRDPFFPAWLDTIQVNYFCDEARKFMTDQLLQLADLCDGVRCDMAMLQLNNVFQNTWMGVLSRNNINKPSEEFWDNAILKVKVNNPDFIFIAEAYWDMEWELQQLGFDFTYDKRLTDRLGNADVLSIKGHLHADEEFQKKSVRFLENHDEIRAVTKLGKERSIAAAIIVGTIQGMRFFHDGQFEGKKIKLPVQLGVQPFERPVKNIQDFYDKFLSIITTDIFHKGTWQMLYPDPAGPTNDSYNNIFTWLWSYKDERRLVVVNYSDFTSQCRLKFDVPTNSNEIKMVDLLNDVTYKRSPKEILTEGLFVELKAFRGHIFAY